MKLRNLRMESQPKLMIIPLIDIMFFLLVFFIMSTLYMVEQNTIPVNLPQTLSGKQEVLYKVTITLTKEGQIQFEQEVIPIGFVKERARAELARQPETVFLLRADESVPYGKVISLLDEIKLAGAKKIAVATEGRKEK